MSGTISINERDVWMPSGWIYDGVLERLSDVLRDKVPVLSRMLEAAISEHAVAYLDLRDLDAKEMAILLVALSKVKERVLKGGAEAFHDASFFPGFVARIDELLSMLERDP